MLLFIYKIIYIYINVHQVDNNGIKVYILKIYDSNEQWFSNDKTIGYSETLKAVSAIASMTSCRVYLVQ